MYHVIRTLFFIGIIFIIFGMIGGVISNSNDFQCSFGKKGTFCIAWKNIKSEQKNTEKEKFKIIRQKVLSSINDCERNFNLVTYVSKDGEVECKLTSNSEGRTMVLQGYAALSIDNRNAIFDCLKKGGNSIIHPNVVECDA